MRLLVKVLEEKRGTDEENVEAVQRQPRGNFSRVARLVERRCRPASIHVAPGRIWTGKGGYLGTTPHLELLITALSFEMKAIASLFLRCDLMDCKLAKTMSFKRINISGLKA